MTGLMNLDKFATILFIYPFLHCLHTIFINLSFKYECKFILIK